jgi:hypothetical protein
MRRRRRLLACGAPARALAALAAAALLLAALAATPTAAETIQQEGIRLSFGGAIEPRKLPRSHPVPVRISLRAGIAGADGQPLPQLRRLQFAINRVGRLDSSGLPVCHLGEIQPATTAAARQACGGSLVGGGRFAASVQIPEQVPYPSRGRIDAFSGRFHGRPTIFLHVYGRQPIPASYTLPLAIGHDAGPEFGIVLRTSIAASTPSAGRVTSLSLNLGRTYTAGGRRHSFLSASCPAPPGSRFASFPFVRARLGFVDRALDVTVNRSCSVSERAGG